MSEKGQLERLKLLIRKEHSLDSLTDELDLSYATIMGMVHKLKEEDNNISIVKREGIIYITDFGHLTLNNNVHKLQKDSNKIKLGLVSDTMFGSKYQQLTILNDIYSKLYDFGARDFIHLGDISIGIYTGKKAIYNESIFAHGLEEQKDYIADNYPYIKGVQTLFLTGEKDLTHMSGKNKIDIGRAIDKEREDLIYLGPNQCEIDVNGITINAQHSISKRDQPLTVSYRAQEAIRVMRSEDKVDFLFQGHNFQSQSFKMRGIDVTTVPSVIATTPEMGDKGLSNVVGAWYIEFDIEGGKVENIKKISLPYYKTIEDDYLTAKSLKKVRGIK